MMLYKCYYFSVGKGLNDVQYGGSAQQAHGSFSQTADQSLDKSWGFYNHVGSGVNDGFGCHSPIRNPNKAIVTIDSRTTEVYLTAYRMVRR